MVFVLKFENIKYEDRYSKKKALGTIVYKNCIYTLEDLTLQCQDQQFLCCFSHIVEQMDTKK